MTTPFLIPTLILLGAATLVALVMPLLRRSSSSVSTARFDRAVYRDQLREVELDLARGVLGPSEAASARLEIERRLLATRDTDQASASTTRRRIPLAVTIVVVMAVWAAGFYLILGAPGVPDMPFAQRDDMTSHPDVAAAAARLEAKLKASGGDAESWLLLARTETGLRQWGKSADAYRRVLDLAPDTAGPGIEAAYAEMLTLAANGVVTPAAKDAFDAVLARDPDNQIARFYQALAAAQDGKLKNAIEIWLKLAGDLPADSEMRAAIARRVDEAAKEAGLPAQPLPAPSPTAGRQ